MLPWVLCIGVAPTILYVSPNGDDGQTGSRDRPLRSLAAAVGRARSSSIRQIRLLPGVHRLTQPLVLGPEDKDLVLEGPAIVSGSVVIRNWRPEPDGTWSAPAPSDRPIRLLTVDGKIRPRARLPRTGRLRHESVFDVPWMSTTGGGWKRPPTDEELTTMKVREGDLGPTFETRNAEVTVYHMWDESTVGVRSFDPATRTLTFSSRLGHPPGAFGVQEYVVWNTREGLTQPGQWFHDRAKGRIVVRPLPGERLDRARVEAPLVDNAIVLRGAEGVVLRNLIVEGCDARPQAAGFGAGEAEGAISAAGCRGLVLRNVTVRQVNNWGIRVVQSPQTTVALCLAEDCGAGGIRVEGADCVVEDCRIRNVGHLYPSAIGLWAGGERTVVRHNHVADTPYTGILGGAQGMVFEANLIERAMRVLHDGGGIYSGFNGKVTIRGNVVRDIADTGGYGAAAYYIDEQGQGYTLERNLSVGVVEASRNHMARGNTIRENVFVNGGPILLTFARSASYQLERNVAVAGGEVTLRAPEAAFGRLPMDAILAGPRPLVRVTLNDYAEAGRETLRERDVPNLGRLDGLQWTPSEELRRRGFPALDWTKVGPRSKPGCDEGAATRR